MFDSTACGSTDASAGRKDATLRMPLLSFASLVLMRPMSRSTSPTSCELSWDSASACISCAMGAEACSNVVSWCTRLVARLVMTTGNLWTARASICGAGTGAARVSWSVARACPTAPPLPSHPQAHVNSFTVRTWTTALRVALPERALPACSITRRPVLTNRDTNSSSGTPTGHRRPKSTSMAVVSVCRHLGSRSLHSPKLSADAGVAACNAGSQGHAESQRQRASTAG